MDDLKTTKDNDLDLKANIGVGTLQRLFPSKWLSHDLIDFAIRVLMRNKNSVVRKDIAVLHDFDLRRIFDVEELECDKVLALKDIYLEVSTTISRKVGKIFDKKILIIVENSTNIHWTIVVIINPKELFSSGEQ